MILILIAGTKFALMHHNLPSVHISRQRSIGKGGLCTFNFPFSYSYFTMILEKAKRADPRDLSIVKGRNISRGGSHSVGRMESVFLHVSFGLLFVQVFKCVNLLRQGISIKGISWYIIWNVSKGRT